MSAVDTETDPEWPVALSPVLTCTEPEDSVVEAVPNAAFWPACMDSTPDASIETDPP